MLAVVQSVKFKKEYKLALKRGISRDEIDKVLWALIKGEPLDPKYKDHVLKGNYIGRRECHVKNDYLLIYRLGTHSDLFK